MLRGRARVTKSACPICGEAQRPAYRPFCSGRCADVDLHRWLDGDYVILDGDEGPPKTPGSADD